MVGEGTFVCGTLLIERCFKVDVERVKEFSDLPKEGPEYVEPRPRAYWPTDGNYINIITFV